MDSEDLPEKQYISDVYAGRGGGHITYPTKLAFR